MADEAPSAGTASHSATPPSGDFVDDGVVTASYLNGDDEALPSGPAAAPKATDAGGDYDFDDPSLAEPAVETVETPAPKAGAGVTTQSKSGEQVDIASTLSEFTPELLTQAGQLGFGPDDVAAFGTPRALQAAMRREYVRMGQQQAAQRQPQAPPPNPFEQFSKPENILKTIEKDLKPQIDRKALADQGWDTTQIDTWEKMLEANNLQLAKTMAGQTAQIAELSAGTYQWGIGVNAKLAQQEQQFNQRLAQQGVDQWNREFNDICDKLPEESAALVADAKDRHTLKVKVGLLAGVYQQMGQNIPASKDLVEEAMQLAFKDKMQTVARDGVRKEVERRQARGIARARPSGARASAQTAEGRAASRIDDFFHRSRN